MSKTTILIIILVISSIFLSGCLPLNPTPISQSASKSMIETAVASTLAAEKAKEAGAQLSYTATPDSGTPEAEETPESDETAEIEEEDGENTDLDPAPTLANPWMLQSWCADHVGCEKYSIKNRTDSWLQVELKENETGVTGFYSVKSKTTANITLIPGVYNVTYTWWCGEDVKTLSEVKGLGSWIDAFKCPQGFYQRIDK